MDNKITGVAGLELSLDQLEDVAGGYITAVQEKMLRDVLSGVKAGGTSQEQVLALVPQYYEALHSQYPNVQEGEVETWILNNWDSL